MRLESRAPGDEMAVSPVSKAKSAPVAIDLRVEAGEWPPRRSLAAIVRRAVGAAFATVEPDVSSDAELSLLFTDDAHIRALNRRYRKIDRATNVLSFPASSGPDRRLLLGDIVLASETIRREALSQGLTIEAHLAHLIVHGFLHILGYDHEVEAHAVAMERLETGILLELGFPDPYSGA